MCAACVKTHKGDKEVTLGIYCPLAVAGETFLITSEGRYNGALSEVWGGGEFGGKTAFREFVFWSHGIILDFFLEVVEQSLMCVYQMVACGLLIGFFGVLELLGVQKLINVSCFVKTQQIHGSNVSVERSS